MAINLDEHAVFIDRLQMDMVPLSVAKQAVEEAHANADKVEKSLEEIKKAFSNLNSTSND